MSANDYINLVTNKNPKLFRGAMRSSKIMITQEELLHQIRLAFNAGKEAGEAKQSLFKSIFG